MTARALDSFETTARWEPGEPGVLGGDGCPALPVGALRTHEGSGTRWFPEALLVSALEADLMLTFVGMARADGLQVRVYQSSALGQVGAVDDRPRELTALVLRPLVLIDGDEAQVDQARHLLWNALAKSGVAGALRVPPVLQPTVGPWGDFTTRRHQCQRLAEARRNGQADAAGSAADAASQEMKR